MIKKFLVVFSLLTLTMGCVLCAQTWTNPITLNGEWSGYGIGDPYILKYRGVYYLYCSTKDNNIGVKCWSTKDFITWSGPYSCTTETVTKTAYAPEVIYWNGTFYMYTSPSGGGHYILTSDSPTGPFTLVTGNLGKEIDGSVFINDDGKMYFYHASNDGIMGCSMTDPLTIGADYNLTGRMGYGWTEGPTTIKRNGVYYLIYTGNHVLSKGYRIDYAKNTSGPIGSYTPQSAQNPVLINAEGSHVGLGHGSAFVGPDLDSYYYTYHNLVSRNGPFRRLNFDRIAWNGDKMMILGPTDWEQQAFQQADMSDFFDRETIGENWLTPDGGNWTIQNNDRLSQTLSNSDDEIFYKALFDQATESNYTAEFTMKEVHSEGNDARFGAIFGYTDDANYGIAVLNSASNRLEINFKTDNNWGTPFYFNLPSGYKLDVWHHLRIEKEGINYKFFVDGMQKAAISSNLESGKIGYMTAKCQADFGYIALSDKVNGSGIADIYMPVPGIIAAVHYSERSENGASQETCTEGGFAMLNNLSGEWYKYKVNVKTAGLYHLGLRYSATETSGIRIWQGDTDLTGNIVLQPTGTRGTNWRTLTIKGLELPAGYQTLKIEATSGKFGFYEMQITASDSTVITQSDSFDTTYSPDWNYSDGTWTIVSGEADINGHGKRTLGNTGWTDYSIQTDVTYFDNFNGGLIFRVNNPSLGGAGDDPSLGTDYLQAYFVTLSSNGVTLGKHNYNWTSLATGSGTYVTNRKYALKVTIKGANIKVYVDNMETPKLDYTDTRPLISGKVGYRVCNAHVRFDNFSVTTEKNENLTGIKVFEGKNPIELFPNPVSGSLTVRNIENFSDLSIYSVDGRVIYRQKISGSSCLIDTETLDKGLYLLSLSGKSGNSVIRKFVKN